MSNEAFAGLRMRARADDPSPNTQGNAPEGDETKEHEMTEDEHKAAVAEASDKARAEGFAAANARMAKVQASEHYAGREQLTHQMLGNSKLEADEIIASLAAAEKKPDPQALSEAQQLAAAEEGGRKEMKEAIQQGANSGIDATGGGKEGKSDAKASAGVWDQAYARVFPGNKSA